MEPAVDALTYICTKFDLDRHTRRLPIEIPNTNRETLARLTFLLGYTRGVEVGTERGAYSEVLLRENPLLQLTCVDAWKAYRGYRDHVDQRKLDRFFDETRTRLVPFGERATCLRKFSVEAAREFENGSLDFVYLDANHNLQNVIADIAAWSPKLKPGGILAGHDYRRHKWPDQIHVVQGVHAWADAYDIAPWFVLGTKEKVDGQLRDDGRSWFWINQPREVIARGERPVQQ
jgi:predicted O-methyltransferase YrrM